MTSEGSGAQERRDDHSLEGMEKRLREATNRMLLEMPRDMDLDAQKQIILSRFEDRGRNLFPEHQDRFAGFIERLRAAHFSSKEQMAEEIANQFNVLVTTISSPEELEGKLRNDAAEQSGWIKVNEALSYDLEEDEISLHVPMIFTKKPLEMYRLFNNGLRVLASQLQIDPALKDIKQIFGYSWIIFEHPDLLKKMGFILGERDEKKKEALAFITRDNFIEHYGN